MSIPFTFGKIASGSSFTDREEEQQDLFNYIRAKTNVVILSPRRWGKSSLVKKTSETFRETKNVRFAFIDMFSVRTEKDFYELFTKEILRAVANKWDERLELSKSIFKKLIPNFSFGADPLNEFSVQFDWTEVQKHPNEILDLPESLSKRKNIQLVVCLDEFQNINFLPDPLAFQKRLRAAWQQFENCSFIIYGSRRHMLSDIFSHPSMPFYKFGALIHLKKIPEPYWIDFISWHFENSGKHIDKRLCQKIVEEASNHPATVQQLAQATWIRTTSVCTDAIVEEALEHTIIQMSPLFENIINSLTGNQINLLKAITDGVKEYTGKEALKKYEMGTSATVLRSRASLEQKEIVDFFGKEPEFEDPFFKLWFTRYFYRK